MSLTMQIDGTKIQMSGLRAEAVEKLLVSFATRSPYAKQHLKAAGNMNIEIKIANGGAPGETCHADIDNGVVYLYWIDCHNDERQMAESCLFEIQNCLNKTANDRFYKDLKKFNGISWLEYGRLMALEESKCSQVVCKILTQVKTRLGGYTPSSWGQEQISAVNRFSTTGDFANYFANDVHSSSAGPLDPKSMPSKYLYVHQRLTTDHEKGSKLAGARSHFQKITSFPMVAPNQKKIKKSNMSDLFKTFHSWNMRPSRFFAYYVKALHQLQDDGWQIHLNETNDLGGWERCANEIIRVEKVTGVAFQVRNICQVFNANAI